MRNFRLGGKAFAVVVLVFGFAGAGFAAAAGHAHGHGQEGLAALTLDHGSKWATDEALRKGMANVRAAMAAARPAIDGGGFTAADYGTLATKVEGELGAIIAQCKLPEAADAQLHLVLVQVVQGIGAMRGTETDSDRKAGADTVMRALDAYAEFFSDPAFVSPQH